MLGCAGFADYLANGLAAVKGIDGRLGAGKGEVGEALRLERITRAILYSR